MQFFQTEKIRKYSRMQKIGLIFGGRYTDIIVIEYEPLHILHMMKCFTVYFAYVIVGHIDDTQFGIIVVRAKDIPR